MVYLVSANFSYFISTNGWAGGGGGNPLSPNSSETAWNFKTPFYRMEAGSLRMVYVNFHKTNCLRDFFGRGGGLGRRGVSFVVELLRDGLEFPNALLQDGYR